MKPKELETAHEKTGATPQEFVVGSDALAVYVNRQNPIDEISLEQLAEIYGEGGQIVAWDQLGVNNAACSDGQIIRVSRQNSSGTYAYFRERVLGKKREYKQGATAQSGSADIVALVSQTPCAIGYSGMGYNSDEVKVLKIAPKPGEPAVAPSLETAQNGTYPIARPLYLYTLGEPQGAVAEFLEWILSDEGQKIVAKKGYVPLVQATAATP
jgi:phosphate transport system substrate-binding protein